jgi:hypothetical protein
MRSIRYVVAVCAGVVAMVATLILAVPTEEAEADPIRGQAQQTYDIWLQNIAGWKMHRASTTNGLVAAVTTSIQNRDADFVAFNEICRQQYNAIIGELRSAGWPQDSTNFARFGAVRSDVCNGQDFGNAIFSRHPLGNASRFLLPDDGSIADHSVLCAPLQDQPAVRFCTTHITTSNEVIDGVKANQRQLDAANARMEEHQRPTQLRPDERLVLQQSRHSEQSGQHRVLPRTRRQRRTALPRVRRTHRRNRRPTRAVRPGEEDRHDLRSGGPNRG